MASQDLAHAMSAQARFRSAEPIRPAVMSGVSTLKIPHEHVSVRSFHEGFNGKTLIHIQDPHSNYSGQKNIAKTIEHFAGHYGIKTVLVEGGYGDVTLDDLRGIASKKDWSIVANKFLMKSLITGPEYLNLTSDVGIKLFGIEDTRLYEANVLAYSKIADKREEIKRYLHTIQVSVDRLKNRLYSRALLAYEARRSKNPDDAFIEKFTDLLELIKNTPLSSLPGYPEVLKLKNLKQQEALINFEAIDLELQNLWSVAGTASRHEDAKTLMEFFHKGPRSHYAQASLLEDLFDRARSSGADLAAYPNLVQYADYLKAFNNLRTDNLFEELESLEDHTYGQLLEEEDTKKVRAIDRYLGLIQKAYAINLTSAEYQMLTYNKPIFQTKLWMNFLNEKLQQLNYVENLLTYQPLLESSHDNIVNFYTLVQQRDQAFVQNANTQLKDQDRAFLITGGYHTENLTHLLKQKGYSLITLTPMVESETNQRLYEKILLSGITNQNTRKDSSIPAEIGIDEVSYVSQAPLRAPSVSASRMSDIKNEAGGRIPTDELEGILVGARMADRGKAGVQNIPFEKLTEADIRILSERKYPTLKRQFIVYLWEVLYRLIHRSSPYVDYFSAIKNEPVRNILLLDNRSKEGVSENLGDKIVDTVQTLAFLRTAHPESKIYLVTSENDLINPEEIVQVGKDQFQKMLFNTMNQGTDLRNYARDNNIDMIVDLAVGHHPQAQPFLRASTRVYAEINAGYGSAIMTSDRVRRYPTPPFVKSAVFNGRVLADQIRAVLSAAAGRKIRDTSEFIREPKRRGEPEHLTNSKTVLFALFSSRRSKDWTDTDSIVSVVQDVIDRGGRGIFPAPKDSYQKTILDRITDKLRPEDNEKIEVDGTYSLAGLNNLIRRSDLVVAVDSGAGHLAAALNKPVVSLIYRNWIINLVRSATLIWLPTTKSKRQRHYISAWLPNRYDPANVIRKIDDVMQGEWLAAEGAATSPTSLSAEQLKGTEAGATPDQSAARMAKIKKYPDAESVIKELQRRSDEGLPNNAQALQSGDDKDRALYNSAYEFGVELSTTQKKYPDAESVIKELQRRSDEGLLNNARALQVGDHKDRALYNSALEYEVELPKAESNKKYPDFDSVKNELQRRSDDRLPNNAGALTTGDHKDKALYNSALHYGVALPRAEPVKKYPKPQTLNPYERIRGFLDKGREDIASLSQKLKIPENVVRMNIMATDLKKHPNFIKHGARMAAGKKLYANSKKELLEFIRSKYDYDNITEKPIFDAKQYAEEHGLDLAQVIRAITGNGILQQAFPMLDGGSHPKPISRIGTLDDLSNLQIYLELTPEGDKKIIFKLYPKKGLPLRAEGVWDDGEIKKLTSTSQLMYDIFSKYDYDNITAAPIFDAVTYAREHGLDPEQVIRAITRNKMLQQAFPTLDGSPHPKQISGIGTDKDLSNLQIYLLERDGKKYLVFALYKIMSDPSTPSKPILRLAQWEEGKIKKFKKIKVGAHLSSATSPSAARMAESYKHGEPVDVEAGGERAAFEHDELNPLSIESSRRVFGESRTEKTLITLLNSIGSFGDVERWEDLAGTDYKRSKFILSDHGVEFIMDIYKYYLVESNQPTIDANSGAFVGQLIHREAYVLSESAGGKNIPHGLHIRLSNGKYLFIDISQIISGLGKNSGELAAAHKSIEQLFHKIARNDRKENDELYIYRIQSMTRPHELNDGMGGSGPKLMNPIELANSWKSYHDDGYQLQADGGLTLFNIVGIATNDRSDGSMGQDLKIYFSPDDVHSSDWQILIDTYLNGLYTPDEISGLNVGLIGHGIPVDIFVLVHAGVRSIHATDINRFHKVMADMNIQFGKDTGQIPEEATIVTELKSGVPSNGELDLLMMNVPGIIPDFNGQTPRGRSGYAYKEPARRSWGITLEDFNTLIESITQRMKQSPKLERFVFRVNAILDQSQIESNADGHVKMKPGTLRENARAIMRGHPSLRVVPIYSEFHEAQVAGSRMAGHGLTTLPSSRALAAIPENAPSATIPSAARMAAGGQEEPLNLDQKKALRRYIHDRYDYDNIKKDETIFDAQKYAAAERLDVKQVIRALVYGGIVQQSFPDLNGGSHPVQNSGIRSKAELSNLQIFLDRSTTNQKMIRFRLTPVEDLPTISEGIWNEEGGLEGLKSKLEIFWLIHRGYDHYQNPVKQPFFDAYEYAKKHELDLMQVIQAITNYTVLQKAFPTLAGKSHPDAISGIGTNGPLTNLQISLAKDKRGQKKIIIKLFPVGSIPIIAEGVWRKDGDVEAEGILANDEKIRELHSNLEVVWRIHDLFSDDLITEKTKVFDAIDYAKEHRLGVGLVIERIAAVRSFSIRSTDKNNLSNLQIYLEKDSNGQKKIVIKLIPDGDLPIIAESIWEDGKFREGESTLEIFWRIHREHLEIQKANNPAIEDENEKLIFSAKEYAEEYNLRAEQVIDAIRAKNGYLVPAFLTLDGRRHKAPISGIGTEKSLSNLEIYHGNTPDGQRKVILRLYPEVGMPIRTEGLWTIDHQEEDLQGSWIINELKSRMEIMHDIYQKMRHQNNPDEPIFDAIEYVNTFNTKHPNKKLDIDQVIGAITKDGNLQPLFPATNGGSQGRLISGIGTTKPLSNLRIYLRKEGEQELIEFVLYKKDDPEAPITTIGKMNNEGKIASLERIKDGSRLSSSASPSAARLAGQEEFERHEDLILAVRELEGKGQAFEVHYDGVTDKYVLELIGDEKDLTFPNYGSGGIPENDNLNRKSWELIDGSGWFMVSQIKAEVAHLVDPERLGILETGSFSGSHTEAEANHLGSGELKGNESDFPRVDVVVVGAGERLTEAETFARYSGVGSVVSIDIDLANTIRHIQELDGLEPALRKKIVIVRDDVMRHPLGEEAFDIFYSAMVFVPEMPGIGGGLGEVLRKIHRALKPDGLLMTGDYTRFGGTRQLGKYFKHYGRGKSYIKKELESKDTLPTDGADGARMAAEMGPQEILFQSFHELKTNMINEAEKRYGMASNGFVHTIWSKRAMSLFSIKKERGSGAAEHVILQLTQKQGIQPNQRVRLRVKFETMSNGKIIPWVHVYDADNDQFITRYFYHRSTGQLAGRLIEAGLPHLGALLEDAKSGRPSVPDVDYPVLLKKSGHKDSSPMRFPIGVGHGNTESKNTEPGNIKRGKPMVLSFRHDGAGRKDPKSKAWDVLNEEVHLRAKRLTARGRAPKGVELSISSNSLENKLIPESGLAPPFAKWFYSPDSDDITLQDSSINVPGSVDWLYRVVKGDILASQNFYVTLPISRVGQGKSERLASPVNFGEQRLFVTDFIDSQSLSAPSEIMLVNNVDEPGRVDLYYIRGAPGASFGPFTYDRQKYLFLGSWYYDTEKDRLTDAVTEMTHRFDQFRKSPLTADPLSLPTGVIRLLPKGKKRPSLLRNSEGQEVNPNLKDEYQGRLIYLRFIREEGGASDAGSNGVEMIRLDENYQPLTRMARGMKRPDGGWEWKVKELDLIEDEKKLIQNEIKRAYSALQSSGQAAADPNKISIDEIKTNLTYIQGLSESKGKKGKIAAINAAILILKDLHLLDHGSSYFNREFVLNEMREWFSKMTDDEKREVMNFIGDDIRRLGYWNDLKEFALIKPGARLAKGIGVGKSILEPLNISGDLSTDEENLIRLWRAANKITSTASEATAMSPVTHLESPAPEIRFVEEQILDMIRSLAESADPKSDKAKIPAIPARVVQKLLDSKIPDEDVLMLFATLNKMLGGLVIVGEKNELGGWLPAGMSSYVVSNYEKLAPNTILLESSDKIRGLKVQGHLNGGYHVAAGLDESDGSNADQLIYQIFLLAMHSVSDELPRGLMVKNGLEQDFGEYWKRSFEGDLGQDHEYLAAGHKFATTLIRAISAVISAARLAQATTQIAA